MKHVLILLCLLVMAGCGAKKLDPAQLAKGNDLISAGKFEDGIAILDEMAKQNISDPALTQARVAAHLKYANYFMNNENVDRKVKYRSALKHYRMVLALDPANTEAKTSADLIIGIYNQMGRPVPTE